MYKTISIQHHTYNQLQAIAKRMDKPKAQVIAELINAYNESIKEQEQQELKEHNAFVAKLAAQIKLPKGTKIKSEDLDKDFSVLADQDF